MKKKPCQIEVHIPKGADAKYIGAAVEEALEKKLTDAVFKSCKEITIIVTKFGDSGR